MSMFFPVFDIATGRQMTSQLDNVIPLYRLKLENLHHS